MSTKKIRSVALLILIITIAAAAHWYKQQYDILLESTSKGLLLGETFGKTISQSTCMVGLKLKYRSCETTACELSANGYISGCMKNAKRDHFCSEVPSVKEAQKSLNWVSKMCRENKLDGSKCRNYMHKFVSHCTEQTENRKRSNVERFGDSFKRGITKEG
jgi:hypothetical protein